MSKFNELVDKLREIFQIDRPELDFGIYRILNSRADEINEYLEKRLKEKVEQTLASGNSANVDQLKEELKKATTINRIGILFFLSLEYTKVAPNKSPRNPTLDPDSKIKYEIVNMDTP